MPSPVGHSRTQCAPLSAQIPACHSLWAAGHPPLRPSTPQTARSGGSKMGVSEVWASVCPRPLSKRERAHARAHTHTLPSPCKRTVTHVPPGGQFSDTPVTESPPTSRKAMKDLKGPPLVRFCHGLQRDPPAFGLWLVFYI